jgi:hypothetical protein
MTDRELLEFAAKAAGYGDVWSLDAHPDVTYIGPRYAGGTVRYRVWNPLTDDGDALRLAVKLQMNVHLDSNMVDVDPDGVNWFSEAYGTDRYAATRRAITRAAAEIGKAMP